MENSIILNASGAVLNTTTGSSVFIKPMRDSGAPTGLLTNWKPPAGFNLTCYNPTTGELAYFIPT